ncbi:MAG TPA: glycosyltransferase family 87 protein [Ktedonobacterales bacterium]|nr:glycosyltransferase family 87 protein [Ktedonobacterales bacterium]
MLSRPIVRGVGIVALLLALGVFGYWGVWLPLHSSGYDFTGPYEAGYALAHHASLQVYDVQMQRIFNAQVLHLPAGPSDFRWTPPSAALLIPFGFLPYTVARIIWWALSLAALLASLWLLARCITITARKAGRTIPTWVMSLTLLGAAALAQPVTDSLRLGQSTTFLLLGFAMVAYGAVKERPVVAGVGLAIAILDKFFPGILLLFFFWRGNYRLCLTCLATIALLIVVTLPFTGVAMYGAFVEALRTYSNQPNAGPVNLSLYHALIVLAAALLHPGASEPTSGPLPILALLVCVALFGALLLTQGAPDIVRRLRPARWGQRRGPAMSPLFAVSWAVCSLLLVEPIVWIFYYILLLVPLAWLLSALVTGSDDRARVWLLVGLIGYLIATLVFPLDPRTAEPMSAAFVLGIAAHPVGLALVWLAHAGYYLHARRSAGYRASAAESDETKASGTMIPRPTS